MDNEPDYYTDPSTKDDYLEHLRGQHNMTKIILLPTYSPACSPAVCATGTQYVCPDFWTSGDGNAVWNASTNRWDLYQLSASDHFWAITGSGWTSGLRPTSIDFVLNLNENAFWSFDLFDANGDVIFSNAASIGPGLVTHNEVTSFGGPGALDDIGNGNIGPPVHALKLGTFGTMTAELVSICFRPS